MSQPDQISQIWTQAIARYEKISERTLDLSTLKEITTVEQLLGSIEREHESFSEFRAHRSRLFSALKTAMAPVQLVSDVASAGAQTAFPPAAAIFGAVKHLLDAAHGVSNRYDMVVDLMGTLKDVTVRLGVYAEHRISAPLREKLTEILATMLEVFAIAHHQIERGRIRAFGKNLLLGDDDGKAAVLDKLNALVDGEQSLAGAETLATVKRVDSNITKLTQHIDKMHAGMAQYQIDQAQERRVRDHLKRVLQPTSSATDRYTAINRSRTRGTGNWILEEKVFQDWVNRVKPLLWVTGTPGAGKTYLASSIISYLGRRFPQNIQHPSRVSIAYFFFRDDNVKTRSLHQALCDIAFDVAQNDLRYAKHIASNVDTAEDITTLDSIWQKLFVDFFLLNKSIDNSAYIVLDALDEAFADDRSILVEMLNEIQPGGRLHVLMLGRPHITEEVDDITRALSGPAIYVSELNNSEDIMRYIKSRIAKSVYLRRASKALQSDIVERLSTGAQGMFIWVDLMLKEILKKRDEGNLRRALTGAPNGLSEMIRHVLIDISQSLKSSPKYADDLNEMLAWATFSPRPLKLKEMDAILKWRSDTGDSWIWLEGDLRRQYASFFVLDRKDGLTTSDLQHQATYRGDSNSRDSDEDYGEDTDNVPDFNSDPVTTSVTLMHASLGDFFRSESNEPVSADNGPLIGVDSHDAKVMLLKRSYQIISCPESSPKKNIATILLDLASSTVIPMLKALDIRRCKKADKQTIGYYLVQLLTDEWAMPRFSMYMEDVPRPEDVLSLFMRWLGDLEIQEALPSADRAWCASVAAGNTSDLFLPIVRYVASSWLAKDADATAKAQHLCIFLHNYLYLRGESLACSVDSVETIMETAEWCGFEKSAMWHHRVAMALRDLGFARESVKHFRKSIELGSMAEIWLARIEMGKACIYIRDFDCAIETLEVCEQQLDRNESPFPDDSNAQVETAHRALELLGLCHSRLGRLEKSLTLYKRASWYDDRCNACVRAILAHFHIQGRHVEFIAHLQGMDTKIPGSSITRLSEYIITNSELSDPFTDWLSVAAHNTSSIDWMVTAYASAAIAASRAGKVVQAATLELTLGFLHRKYKHNPAGATRIWEGLLNTCRRNRSDGEMTFVLETASNQLATQYLSHAMETGMETPEGRRCGKLMELLAQGKALYIRDVTSPVDTKDKHTTKADGERFVTNAEVGLILGNYYKVARRESEALACYRAQVKEFIRLLDDNDPLNDGTAFWRLAATLASVGNRNWAVSMWHQSYSLAHESSKDAEEADALSAICSGCHASIAINMGTLWICQFCHKVILCGSCQKLQKEGSLPVNVCSQKHDWILLPPIPQSVRERGEEHKGLVFVEGRWATIDEVKQRLMDI